MAAGTAALILCAERGDRKALFDALEPLDLAAVYTANSVAQARQFLAEAAVRLLVLELAFEPTDVDQLLADFRAVADGRILAVLPPADREAGWSWEFLPPGVTECMGSPVDPGEAAYRLGRILNDPASEARRAVDEREEELLFDAVDDEYLFSEPRSGQLLEVNDAFLAAAGGDAGDWVGQSVLQIGLVESDEQRSERMKTLSTDGEVRFHCRRRTADGALREVAVWRRLGVRDGRLVYLTRIRDVGRDVRRARALAAIGALAIADRAGGPRLVTELLDEILDLDHVVAAIRDDEGGLFATVAHSRGEGGAVLLDPEAHRPLQRLLAGESLIAFAAATTVVGPDPFLTEQGLEAYLGLPIRDGEGAVIGYVVGARRKPLEDGELARAVLRVIAGRESAQRQIRELRERSESQGLHDGLTGLPNRLLFNDRIALAIQEARRTGEMIALMFVDLDRFKNINDTLGHAVGDEVLRSVAGRLRDSVRGSDTVARYAGDEFTVLLRHITQKDDVLRVAQKINRILAEPLQVRGTNELQITASIGVSFFPDDGPNAEALLRHADTAMYGAKGMGRNTTQTYVEQAPETRQQKLVLEAKLRHAEANGELRVFYQPQVSTDTEDVVGMEALIRWEHPELGLISPGFFIPLAEETGLIVPIGEWLLRKAVVHTRAWHERFGLPLVLGVNLSPLQLKQPNLVTVVETALNEAGLEPRYLDLEVTESISIKSIPGLRDRLGELRELGCSISIDDFGTGQSSLDYLKRFPADRIKIDQSFVRNIGVDPDDEAIVRATISMAHSLKLGVIAEGVEEEGHLEFLRDNGCDQCQGYLFCRPLPSDTFSRLLMEREALTVGPQRAAD